MAKFSGKIGFSVEKETSPGVYLPDIVERAYRGDLISRKVRLETNGESTNRNLTLNNDISIVADRFAKENLGYMVYAILHGQKWAITSADVESPRIRLTLGGLWHG